MPKKSIFANLKAQAQDIFKTIDPRESHRAARAIELNSKNYKNVVDTIGQNAKANDMAFGIDGVFNTEAVAGRYAKSNQDHSNITDFMGRYMYGKEGVMKYDTGSIIQNAASFNSGVIDDALVDGYKKNQAYQRAVGSGRMVKNTLKDYYVNPYKNKDIKTFATRVAATGVAGAIGYDSAKDVMEEMSDRKQLY